VTETDWRAKYELEKAAARAAEAQVQIAQAALKGERLVNEMLMARVETFRLALECVERTKGETD
jgi:predicted metal-dependent hydrolase